MPAYAQWSLEAHVAEHRALDEAGKGNTAELTVSAFPFYKHDGNFDPIGFVINGFLPFYTAAGLSKPILLKEDAAQGRIYWIRYFDRRELFVEAGTNSFEFETTYKLVRAFASLQLASSGTATELAVKVNGSTIATLIFPAGETLSNIYDISLLKVYKGDKLTVDVISTAAPAKGLTLMVVYK